MNSVEIQIVYGERPDLKQIPLQVVWVWMETETGIFIGEVYSIDIFQTSFAICYIDITRLNQHSKSMSISESGSSSNKCSDTYKGSEAFSEIEFRNIRDYVVALDPKPILAHALHSYSQLWLYPYGYAHNALPDNWKEIVRMH